MPEEVEGQGILLALEAVSESLVKQNDTLSKMDTYFSKMLRKQEEEEEDEEEEEEEVKKSEERTALIKDITNALELSYPHIFKQQYIKETPATLKTKTEEVQKPIQAAEEPVEEEKLEEKKAIQKQDKEELPEEEEKEKAGAEEEKEYPEVEKSIKKADKIQKSVDEQVKEAVAAQLRKMGWKEEEKVITPRKSTLGAEVPIMKSEPTEEDAVTQLAKEDYKTLRAMQMRAEIEDLPPEIRQLIS